MMFTPRASIANWCLPPPSVWNGVSTLVRRTVSGRPARTRISAVEKPPIVPLISTSSLPGGRGAARAKGGARAPTTPTIEGGAVREKGGRLPPLARPCLRSLVLHPSVSRFEVDTSRDSAARGRRRRLRQLHAGLGDDALEVLAVVVGELERQERLPHPQSLGRSAPRLVEDEPLAPQRGRQDGVARQRALERREGTVRVAPLVEQQPRVRSE